MSCNEKLFSFIIICFVATMIVLVVFAIVAIIAIPDRLKDIEKAIKERIKNENS